MLQFIRVISRRDPRRGRRGRKSLGEIAGDHRVQKKEERRRERRARRQGRGHERIDPRRNRAWRRQ